MSPRPKIAVIGGGVIGITSALLLRIAGFRPRVFTNFPFRGFNPNQFAGIDIPGGSSSELASLHGAASVIPHSVEISGFDLGQMTDTSQAFFSGIQGDLAVRKQRHYEIFESPREPPEYKDAVYNFTMLPTGGEGLPGAPRRTTGGKGMDIYGWHFDTFFTEAVRYLRGLYELFEISAGEDAVINVGSNAMIDLNKMRHMSDDYDAFILCVGGQAPKMLASEKSLGQLRRGHYLKLGFNQVVKNNGKYGFFSYNYSPSPDIYSANKERDRPADVYFYPRRDGWYLGGSRQLGILDSNGAWIGENTVGESLEFMDAYDPAEIRSVPAPIFTLNRQIIKDLTGYDIGTLPDGMIRAGIGYRFTRIGGVRLEYDDSWDKPLVHNYGHGGSGYTLSWACALEVVRMMRKNLNFEPQVRPRGTGSFEKWAILDVLSTLCQERLG